MTATITWTISQLDRSAADGAVTTAHWRVTAKDGALTSTIYGAIGFTPDPSSEGFVPYPQLTEADVLSWVWDAFAAQKEQVEEEQKDTVMTKDEIEAGLLRHIELQKAPATVSGTPWQA
jgi:hypothetical protein